MTDSRSMTPSPFSSLKGRAFTAEEKRDVMEAILAAWIESRHLRLGQLLVCAIGTDNDPFFVEDSALVDACVEFAAELGGRRIKLR